MSTKSKKSAKAETIGAMIVAVATLVEKSVDELVEFVSSNLQVAGAAYVNVAKAIIALDPKLDGGRTIYGVLTAKGIKKSTVSNAMYLVNLYYGLVRPGLVTEEFMAGLTYMDAYRLSAIAKKNGGWAGLHAKRIHELSPDDWESLHETGLTVAEAAKAEQTLKEAKAKEQADAIAKAAKEQADKALAAEAEAKKAKAAATPQPAAPAAPAPATTKNQSAPTTPAAPAPTAQAPATPAPAAPAVKPPAPVARKNSLVEYRKLLDLARKAFEEMALDESVTAEDVSLGVQATLELAQAAQVAAQVRAQVELAKPEETPAAEPALAEAA